MDKRQKRNRRKSQSENMTTQLGWIKQHGLKCEVVTLHDIYLELPSVDVGTAVLQTSKPAFLHANGFQYWSAAGIL